MKPRSSHIVIVGPRTLEPGRVAGTVQTFRVFCDTIEQQVDDGLIPGITEVRVIDNGSRSDWAPLRLINHVRALLRLVAHVVLAPRPPVGLVWFMSAGVLRFMSPLVWLTASRCPTSVLPFGGWLGESVPSLPKIHRQIIVSSLNRAAVVGAQSNRAAEAAKAVGVRNVVTTGSIRARPSAEPRLECTSTRPLRLFFAGHVNTAKGVRRAIALTNASDGRITLDVIGPVWPEDADMVDTAGPGVTFHGKQQWEDVLRTARESDFVILLSTYEGEGIPGVVVESLSVGTPAIISDHLALPELIDDGVSGFIEHVTPQWEPSHLLDRLLALGTADLVAMRKAAYARSSDHDEDRWLPLVLDPILRR